MHAPTSPLTIPPVADNPSPGDLINARTLLDQVIRDFPFVDDTSKTNFLGLLLTSVLRHVIDGPVPLALIDAPEAGTGKGLLADVVAIISTGRSAAFMTAPHCDEEWRKHLTAKLLSGTTLITIDNIDHPLKSGELCSVLTANCWTDRILGQSQDVKLPIHVTWMATGNNIQLAGDIPRRCYWIRLDAKVSRPWERFQFTHPKLRKYLYARRGEVFAALVTLYRTWVVAGRPEASPPVLGSFEEWSRLIGNVLAYAGIGGFLSNLNQMYESTEEERRQWEGFLQAWYSLFIDGAKLANDIAQVIDTTYGCQGSPFGALPGDLDDAYSVRNGSFSRQLGKTFARQENRRFGSYHLEKCGHDGRTKATFWRVVKT